MTIETYPITQVIIQTTTFCNLDCNYCYIPSEQRSFKNKMSVEVAIKALQWVFESGRAASKIGIRFHAGEPMSVGLEFYQKLIPEIRKITPPEITVGYSIQTNGIFVNEQWCDFFKTENVRVGLSLDGPEFLHNQNRVTRQGKATHHLVMRAVELFHKNKVEFDVIAVITPKTVQYPNEFYHFFAENQVKLVGLNIEETEGANQSQISEKEIFLQQYNHFIKHLYKLQKDGSVIIREIEDISNAILFGNGYRKSLMAIPFSIVSIDYQGNISTFSPELLGNVHKKYGDFTFGNIYKNSINDILKLPKFVQTKKDIETGVQMCQKYCDYFFLCGGGSPSNKLYENGSFESTETLYCQARIKTVVDVVLENIEFELQQKPKSI